MINDWLAEFARMAWTKLRTARKNPRPLLELLHPPGLEVDVAASVGVLRRPQVVERGWMWRGGVDGEASDRGAGHADEAHLSRQGRDAAVRMLRSGTGK